MQRCPVRSGADSAVLLRLPDEKAWCRGGGGRPPWLGLTWPIAGAEGAEAKPSSAEVCGCNGVLCGRRSGADSAFGRGELPASSMDMIMSEDEDCNKPP